MPQAIQRYSIPRRAYEEFLKYHAQELAGRATKFMQELGG